MIALNPTTPLTMLALILFILPFQVAGSDAGREATHEYLATTVIPLPSFNCDEGDWPDNSPDALDSICFEILPGETKVSLSFEDATGSEPVFYYRFDGAGSAENTCGDVTLDIPADADGELHLWVTPAPRVNIWPVTQGCTGVGTTGTVTATFS